MAIDHSLVLVPDPKNVCVWVGWGGGGGSGGWNFPLFWRINAFAMGTCSWNVNIAGSAPDYAIVSFLLHALS